MRMFGLNVCREGCAIRELARPMQSLLTYVLHPGSRPGDRDGQLVPAGLELRVLRGLPHLRHDSREF
jgi:hypothetical protein